MGSESVMFQEAAELVRQGVNPEDVGDVPYIGLEHIEENTLRLIGIGSAKNVTSTKFKFSKGDILFGKLRPYFRKVIRPNFDGVCSTDIWVVRAKPGVDQGYLYYWMASNDFVNFATQGSEGTKMPRAKWEHVGRFRRHRIEKPEQRAIAHILGSLDDKIELNRRMNKTLEAIARAIFKSWFVDFDPVRAKAEGRPTGLPDDIAALFPDSFEDLELGEIPKGWEGTRLSNKMGFQGGFAFKSKDWQDVGVPVVKIGSVKPGVIDLNQVSYVSNSIAEEARRFRLNIGDLLIGMTGYVGEVGIVPPTDQLPLLNQRVGRFILPHGGTNSLGFWYCTTRRSEFKRYVESVAHGTAQANVSGSGIMSYELVVPNDELISFFNRLSQPFFDKILENYKEINNLASLRDTLLPKLICGELRVPDAEKFVEEAGL